GRAAAPRALRPGPRLSPELPRRRPVAGLGRGPGSPAPGTAAAAARRVPAGTGFRASLLERGRRQLPERPAAAALYRGGAGARLPQRRPGAGDAAAPAAAGEPLELPALPPLDDPRGRVPRRDPAPHRLRPAARRQ